MRANPWSGLIGERPTIRVRTRCPNCMTLHRLENPQPLGAVVALICHCCETSFFVRCPGQHSS